MIGLRILEITVLAAALSLAGCDTITKEAHTSGTFEVTGMLPGKYGYIDLKDTETGKVHEDVYVDMYCYNMRKHAEIGNTYKLDLMIRTRESGAVEHHFTNISTTFCP